MTLSSMADPQGSTPTERYLTRLSRRAFLRMWSYSGLFRDQGRKARGGEGAELCDLLVVFGHHILIFSDKSCDFPDVTDREVAWRRWFTRAVLGSARQIWGAERWLRSNPHRVFLDRACQRPFPIPLPDPRDACFHRIVIAHDRTGRRRKLAGGSGTLMLDPDIQGEAHLLASSAGGHPFAIGHVDPRRGFVHVFDELTLDIVFQVLDTVTDFVKYLTRKEELILSRRLAAFGEEDLLAFYLRRVDESGEHVFAVPPGEDKLLLAEGHWRGLAERPEYHRKVAADRVSYFWDEVIDHVAGHAIDGTLEAPSDPALAPHERALRILASESRVRRRFLARSFRDIILAAGSNTRRIRTMFPSRPEEPYYVFVAVGPPPPEADSSARKGYREYRSGLLAHYCAGVLAAHAAANTVVGIATEGDDRGGRSFDLALVDRTDLSDDDLESVRRISAEERWFADVQMTHSVEHEYPPGPASDGLGTIGKQPVPEVGRNTPCPCGSGKKYKKCHGAS